MRMAYTLCLKKGVLAVSGTKFCVVKASGNFTEEEIAKVNRYFDDVWRDVVWKFPDERELFDNRFFVTLYGLSELLDLLSFTNETFCKNLGGGLILDDTRSEEWPHCDGCYRLLIYDDYLE